jgi:hypothetical protein
MHLFDERKKKIQKAQKTRVKTTEGRKRAAQTGTARVAYRLDEQTCLADSQFDDVIIRLGEE